MRILFYNWTHIDENIGGGVNVYQKQLALNLLEKGHEIYYLNSGLTYDKSAELKLVRYHNKLNEKLISYEVINSPVLAPVQQDVANIKTYLEDSSLADLLADFIRKIQPDVIHFNNIEGLSLAVIKLKQEFSEIRFVYSLHNYFPLCSRVDLWKHTKYEDCNCESHTPDECAKCYDALSYDDEIHVRKIKSTMFKKLMRKCLFRKNIIFHKDDDVELYHKFTVETVKAINSCMDNLLAVSKRVADIYIKHGVDESKVQVMYIGTKVAEQQADCSAVDVYTLPFGLLYMGYMTKVKGFYSFLEAVENIPDEMAKDIHVRIVARHGLHELNAVRRIKKLKSKFHTVELVNGYTLQTQKKLLQGMHLGVVPILWEDNLPQVAIEQIANGVPIITSDLGGAKELFDSDARFVYEARNVNQLIERIKTIFFDRTLLEQFWSQKKHFPTLAEHIACLEQLYCQR